MQDRDAAVTSRPTEPAPWLSAAAVTSATLAACGGGGDDPTPPAPPPETAQCVDQPSTAVAGGSRAPLEAPTYATAARFLSQIGLGATLPDVLAIVGEGNFTDWLNRQFAVPLSGQSVAAWAESQGFADYGAYFGTDSGVDHALWARLLGSPDVVRQRMALAWSQLFVVSSSNMATPWGQFAAMGYWDVLEAHGLGNFRTLLEAVTLSPAMGVFLNMRGSRKADRNSGRQPDENFAREILQLFTIGLHQLRPDGSEVLDACGQPVPTYGNQDVSGLAAVFTGWDFATPALDGLGRVTPSHLSRPMTHTAAFFAEGPKTFLGVTISAATSGPAALKQALDAIFNHPNVAPFIATRLIQQLVTSNPSRAYVARVAAAFADNGAGVRGDLKAVIRAIVLDQEARPALTSSEGLVHGKLREPVLRLVHWARLFRLTSLDGKWAVPNLATTTALGQSPLRAPSVFGFFRPGYVPPNSDVARAGLVAPEFQITDDATVIAYANYMQLIVAFGAAQMVPDYVADGWEARAANPAELVAWLNLALTGGSLLPLATTAIAEAVASIELAATVNLETAEGLRAASGARARVVTAVFLILCSPDFLVQR